MFSEFRYRSALRKYLRDYALTVQSHDSVTDLSGVEGEPDIERAMAKEQQIQREEIGLLMTPYLLYKARAHYIPTPEDEESWLNARYHGYRKFLTPESARKLHLEIRAEDKANWDFWQSRVTFALALIGSIFGVLAFFKR